MKEKELLPAEELDFLGEMMNIGAGNAAGAIAQLFRNPVQLTVSKVTVSLASSVSKLLGSADLGVACSRMAMIGDVSGYFYFIIKDKYRKRVMKLMSAAAPWFKIEGWDDEKSVLNEVANICAGVFFTAIHDFCGLNIFYSVPAIQVDMLQALLDDFLSQQSLVGERMLVMKSELISGKVQALLLETSLAKDGDKVQIFLLMIPSLESYSTLADSIKVAKMKYMQKSS